MFIARGVPARKNKKGCKIRILRGFLAKALFQTDKIIYPFVSLLTGHVARKKSGAKARRLFELILKYRLYWRCGGFPKDGSRSSSGVSKDYI